MFTITQVAKVTVLLLLCCSVAASGNDPSQKDGFLAVTVSLEDRTPLTSAFVFVRGYRHVYRGELSTVLTQTKNSVFENSLPPGVYDVFVSHAGTLPTCKRVVIVAGQLAEFNANLKLDMEHLEK